MFFSLLVTTRSTSEQYFQGVLLQLQLVMKIMCNGNPEAQSRKTPQKIISPSPSGRIFPFVRLSPFNHRLMLHYLQGIQWLGHTDINCHICTSLWKLIDTLLVSVASELTGILWHQHTFQ